jgi:hypothetical protein
VVVHVRRRMVLQVFFIFMKYPKGRQLDSTVGSLNVGVMYLPELAFHCGDHRGHRVVPKDHWDRLLRQG